MHLLLQVGIILFDIREGENVDVIGDAHELSKYLSSGHFDAVTSMSVSALESCY